MILGLAALGCIYIIIERLVFIQENKHHSKRRHQQTLLTLAYAAQPKSSHQALRKYCRQRFNYDPKPSKNHWKTQCKCKRLPPFNPHHFQPIETFITHPLVRQHEQDYSISQILIQTQNQLDLLAKWYNQNKTLYHSSKNQPTECKDFPEGYDPSPSEFSIYQDFNKVNSYNQPSAPPRYEESELLEESKFLV